MSIFKKLTEKGTLLSANNGATPVNVADYNSKLHNSYSIDGNPTMKGKPKPSILDLNGKTPNKYMDNLPK